MRRSSVIAAFVGALLAATPSPAQEVITIGQSRAGSLALSVGSLPATPREPRPRQVRIGDEVGGALGARDPVDDQDRSYEVWRLRLDDGQRVYLTLTSEDFDAYLQIGRGQGEAFEVLAYNDDGADGTNSRLTFTAPAEGDYIIRATSFRPSEGPYRLAVEEAPHAPPARAIAVGETRTGELAREAQRGDDGVRRDPWRLRLAEGQRVAIILRSDDFDTFLTVGRDEGGALADVVEDDDGLGEGLNSRLTLTADRAGDWVIHARGLSSDALGVYRLSVEEIAPDPEPASLSPASGVVQGEIGDTAATGDMGRRFVAYRIAGVEGRRMRAIMRSGDFDTYLELGEDGESFMPIASDDDGLGEGTDSRLDFTFPSTGDYILRASPLSSAGSAGLFSLELLDLGPPPQPGSILVGATVRGTLDDESALNDFRAPYDDYEIRVEAGQKLRLTLVSNAFDAFLAIGRGLAGDFSPTASDDDGLGDTHSRIDITIDEAGDYVIRAAALMAGGEGDYVLTVETRD